MLTKDELLNLLKTNDKAVARALVVLNNRQTADEQATQGTRYLNGMGFRPCHARMGTSMAKFYLQRGFLTPKQIAYWRATDKSGSMRIGLYTRQLLEEAAEKEKQKAILNTEQQRLEYELGMVLDSDDPAIIGAAQADLDIFMAKMRGRK
jgi:hypothetical protein